MVQDFEPTEAEERLLSSAAAGVLCDFGKSDPGHGKSWGEERTIRAPILNALCTESNAEWSLHPLGIQLQGARIVGQLDFENRTLHYPLCLTSCYFDSDVFLDQATIHSLELTGSHIQNLRGWALTVKHSIFLDDGFHANGEIRLYAARVGGDLSASGGTFQNPNGTAIYADYLRCTGSIYLKDAVVRGTVRLPAASVGGALSGSGGEFEACGSPAIFAQAICCKLGIKLDKAKIRGEVNLCGAELGSNFEAEGATIKNPGGDALNAQGLQCQGGLILSDGFSAEGMVRLQQAFIKAVFDAGSATFDNPGCFAIVAENLRCDGNVFFRDGFTSTGEVRLRSASIQGSLLCHKGTFQNSGGTAFDLQFATVGAEFGWDRFSESLLGDVNLTGAHVGCVRDSSGLEPTLERAKHFEFILDGFVWDGVQPADCESWLQWIEGARYSTEPYEQLASIYRRMGHEEDVKKVLVAKHDDKLLKVDVGWLSKLKGRLLGALVGYGYRPWNALWILLGLWLIGFIVFEVSNNYGLMVATDQSNRSFCSVVYSLETLVPVLDLRTEQYWELTSKPGVWGQAPWLYLRIHIILGWVFTTLAVAAFSGLVRSR